jgi:hypothetical protein
MCVYYTSLNKACLKDPFPLFQIDQVVDLITECELLSFLDAYSGYHQIPLAKTYQPVTMFITPFGYFYYEKNVVWTEERRGHIPVVYAILLQGTNRAQPGGLCQRYHHEILKE